MSDAQSRPSLEFGAMDSHQYHTLSLSLSLSLTGEASTSLLDVRPVITNNPRALGQGLVCVWHLYHFPVVPTQGAILEQGEY